MRRLYRACRRCGDPLLHYAGVGSGCQENHHHRSSGGEQGRQGCAAGLARGGRAAMRLLSVRPDHDRDGAAGQEQDSFGRRYRRCHVWEHLPLWHLQPDPRRDPYGREHDAQRGMNMATPVINESRRDFLKSSAAMGGGLVIAFVLPCGARFAEAATVAAFQPNAFIRITPDNRVTVIVGLSEMGQGVLTAIPMLVAEELEVDWGKIRVEQAPADPAFANPIFKVQATGGSTSVRGHWEPMRKAGATARQMLVAAAADTWNVDSSTCHAERGKVIHASGKKLTYGELANRAATMPAPAEVKLKDPKDFKLLGKGAKRLDSPGKVNGTARFGMDVRLPGMLTAVVAHSPVAGGKGASFNADKTKAMPGVKHVVQIGSGVAVVANGYWAAHEGRDALEIKWNEDANAALSSADISKTLGERADQSGVVARKEG